jgi:hypothetical protein
LSYDKLCTPNLKSATCTHVRKVQMLQSPCLTNFGALVTKSTYPPPPPTTKVHITTCRRSPYYNHVKAINQDREAISISPIIVPAFPCHSLAMCPSARIDQGTPICTSCFMFVCLIGWPHDLFFFSCLTLKLLSFKCQKILAQWHSATSCMT